MATTKMPAIDLGVQLFVEKKSLREVDWRRNAVFTAFGFVYLGCVQWAIYVIGMQRLFGSTMTTFCNQPIRDKIRNIPGIRALFAQIGLDFFVVQPAVYFPCFYALKSYVEGTSAGNQQSLGWVCADASTRYRANFWEDNLGMSGFWFFFDIVIYSCPVWARLPVNHAISAAWSGILSVFRGGDGH